MATAPEAPAPTRGLSPAAGCAIALAVTLAGIALVFLVGSLLVRGEIVFARGSLRETRLWLIRESSDEGLGLSTQKILEQGQGRACVTTSVRFLLWRSSAPPEEPVYCRCYERAEAGWTEAGPCP